jgi:hypothetical protein
MRCIARKEYRCTRGVFAETPPSGRNGHYILAWSMEEAICEIAAKFPDEEQFTAQAWNAGRMGSAECQAHMDDHGTAHGHHENQVAYFYRVQRSKHDDENGRVLTVGFVGFGPADKTRGGKVTY